MLRAGLFISRGFGRISGVVPVWIDNLNRVMPKAGHSLCLLLCTVHVLDAGPFRPGERQNSFLMQARAACISFQRTTSHDRQSTRLRVFILHRSDRGVGRRFVLDQHTAPWQSISNQGNQRCREPWRHHQWIFVPFIAAFLLWPRIGIDRIVRIRVDAAFVVVTLTSLQTSARRSHGNKRFGDRFFHHLCCPGQCLWLVRF